MFGAVVQGDLGAPFNDFYSPMLDEEAGKSDKKTERQDAEADIVLLLTKSVHWFYMAIHHWIGCG